MVSSDFCRALVSDNENDQSATGDAFDLLHEIIRKRLARGRLTVVDATNVQPEARKSLIALAKEYHLFAEAIVFDLPERLCQDRNALRPDRKRLIDTRLRPKITVREENAIAALEVMSRFASDPKWLIYLPPTIVAHGNEQA